MPESSLHPVLHHHRSRMSGRDPSEPHRVATPLELLFDLTFVAAFSVASSQLAHALAEGHYRTAILGFLFTAFGICWAWVNFTWFASAYDTDDWVFRLTTMVQMIGVLVLAIGIPRVFRSIDQGQDLDNSILVLGYVIMRIAMVFQWLRAARENPERRHICLIYAKSITIAQIGWVAQIAFSFPIGVSLLMLVILAGIELAAPFLAERKAGGTPWHAHHIVERYGLFAIIALGEGVLGTIATLTAVVDTQGWSIDAILVSVAGLGLTFGLWWVYYMLPSAIVLQAHRDRAFTWAYGQLVTITSIVATGAGLHVAAYYIAHEAHIGSVETLLTVAIPVSLFLGSVFFLYYYLVRQRAHFRWWTFTAPALIIGLAVALAIAGVDMAICLVFVALAPAATVVGYESVGYRHQAEAFKERASEHAR